MNNNQKVIISKLKNKITDFSVKISEKIWKVEAKFSLDMIYGLLSNQDVRLSEIWRWLKEKINIKQTEKRISRNLTKFKKDYLKEIKDSLLCETKKQITSDTVITLDWWDINKEWAEKMENIKHIHDWSKNIICNWYWLNSIVATKIVWKEAINIPLNLNLYSTKDKDFESQNRESIRSIDEVIKIIWNIWIWVMDRWYDRAKNIINELVERKLKFIIRWIWTRDVIREKTWNKIKMKTLADIIKTRKRITYFEYQTLKNWKEIKQKLSARIWYEEIKLPWIKEKIYLCVLKKLSWELSMMMITNKEIKSNDDVIEVFSKYSSRWWVEDTYKYLKQEFKLERIMLKTYSSIQNMMTFILVAMNFVSYIRRWCSYFSNIFIQEAKALNQKTLKYLEHSVIAWISYFLTLSSVWIRDFLRPKILKLSWWDNLSLFDKIPNPYQIFAKL